MARTNHPRIPLPSGMGSVKPSQAYLSVVTPSSQGLDLAGLEKGTQLLLQPIMPLDLPVKVRSWELTVYPRSHIRR